MRQNTRFNPTMCASPHIGHLYIALVNEREAHRSGGRFTVRIDDTQEAWIHRVGKKKMRQYEDEFRLTLSEFMDIDIWMRQSEMPSIQDIVMDTPIGNLIPAPAFSPNVIAELIPDPDPWLYPCTPFLTFEKVVWDYYGQITWLIRGADLLTEAALYEFYSRMLKLRSVLQIYLPRLRAESNRELTDSGGVNVSKINRTYTLQKQLDAFGVDDVLHKLELACLVDPEKGFFLDNIKRYPISREFIE